MISSNLGVPRRNDPCLCTSGRKFKHCCGNIWRDTKFHQAHRKAAFAGDIPGAISRVRAYITWYRICHDRHTKPLIATNHDLGEEILAIDIDAMFELCRDLVEYIGKTNSSSEAKSFVERARFFIDDKRWLEKADLLLLLASLGPDWDENSAREVFSQLKSLEQYDDLEMIMVGLDVLADDLSFAQAYRLAERVEAGSEGPYIKLHYGTLAASLSLRMRDFKGARQKVDSIIGRFEDAALDLECAGAYELSQVVTAMNLAEILQPDRGYGERALIACNKLLDRELTPFGRSRVLRDKGEILKLRKDYVGAISCFRRAHSEFTDYVSIVFEAECVALSGDLEQALRTLQSTDVSQLDSAGQVDYVFVMARIALARGKTDLLEQSLKAIKALQIDDSLFEVVRKDLERDILLALAAGRVAAVEKLSPSTLIERIARYAELRPNAFGLGLNLNAILEDFAKRRKSSDD